MRWLRRRGACVCTLERHRVAAGRGVTRQQSIAPAARGRRARARRPEASPRRVCECRVTLRRPDPRSWQDRRGRRLLPVVLGLAGFAAIAAAPTGADPAPPIPRCFGAAARVPGHPCRNPALRLSVVPSPQDAVLVPDLPCRSLERSGTLDVCGFGASPAGAATETVALLGDSHASQWRAALDVAATSAGWRGISLTRSSCPFTTARARIAPEARGPCREHNREVVAWLRAHPEVHTVFVAAHTGAHVFHD